MRSHLAPLTMILVGAFLSTTAAAEVRFDPASGKGFVSNGDIQRALHWSGKQLEDNAAKVEFYYDWTDNVDWVCTYADGTPGKPMGSGTVARHVQVLTSNPSSDRGGKKGPGGGGFVLTGFLEVHTLGVVCDADKGPMESELKPTVTSSSPAKLMVNGSPIYP